MAFPLLGPLMEIGGKLIDRLIPDKEKAAEAQLKLAELAQSGELARLAADTKITEAVLADTQSARSREVEVSKSPEAPYLNKIITPCLAIGVLGGTFGLFWYMINAVDGDINPSQKDIIIYVLGVLSAISTQVIAYYFGSSIGSTNKDQTIKRIMNGEKIGS